MNQDFEQRRIVCSWKQLGKNLVSLERILSLISTSGDPVSKKKKKKQIRIFQFHLSPRDAALVCITPRCACKGASVDSLLILVLVRPGQTNKRGLKSKSTHSQTAQTRHRETADSSQGWTLRCPAFVSPLEPHYFISRRETFLFVANSRRVNFAQPNLKSIELSRYSISQR